jgi:hypothetical protein
MVAGWFEEEKIKKGFIFTCIADLVVKEKKQMINWWEST